MQSCQVPLHAGSVCDLGVHARHVPPCMERCCATEAGLLHHDNVHRTGCCLPAMIVSCNAASAGAWASAAGLAGLTAAALRQELRVCPPSQGAKLRMVLATQMPPLKHKGCSDHNDVMQRLFTGCLQAAPGGI